MAAYGTFFPPVFPPRSGPDFLEGAVPGAVWDGPGKVASFAAAERVFSERRLSSFLPGFFRRLALAVWRAHNIRLHSRSQPNVNFIL